MYKYHCPRCNYKTNRWQYISRHLNRINPCPSVNKNLPINYLRDCLKLNKHIFKIEPDQLVIKVDDELFELPDQTQNFVCKFCNMVFTRKASLTRHNNHFCKRTKELKGTCSELVSKINTLEEEKKIWSTQKSALIKYYENIITNRDSDAK